MGCAVVSISPLTAAMFQGGGIKAGDSDKSQCSRGLQCAGECRWQERDRDKTGELKRGGGGDHQGRRGTSYQHQSHIIESILPSDAL